MNDTLRKTRQLGERLALANGKWTTPRFPYHSEQFSIRAARSYARAASPELCELPIDAVASWTALGEEIYHQYDTISRFIDIVIVDIDPYADYEAARRDLDSGRLKVWDSVHTGGHPGWSNDMNNMFRAVHDVMGHYRNDLDFSADGEDAAFRGHAETVPDLALPALAVETRGQTAAFWHLAPLQVFKEQKIYMPPTWLYRVYGWEFTF